MSAMSAKKEKKTRAPNFNEAEKQLLKSLVLKYASIIECKKSDSVTIKEKQQKWEEACEEFNSKSTANVVRSVESLKNLWDNLKKEAKKAAARERLETFKTGGGTRDPSAEMSSSQVEILGILGAAGVGNNNPYDDDAAAASSSASAQLVESINFASIVVPQDGEACYEGPLWGNGDVCPRMMYSKKPGALKFSQEQVEASSNAAGGDSSNIPNILEDIKKRTITEEQEYASNSKRRRPTVKPTVKDCDAKKLIAVKLELAQIAKRELEEERERKRQLEEERKKQQAKEEERQNELFLLEKKKKEMEAKIAELQYRKLLKELGESEN